MLKYSLFRSFPVLLSIWLLVGGIGVLRAQEEVFSEVIQNLDQMPVLAQSEVAENEPNTTVQTSSWLDKLMGIKSGVSRQIARKKRDFRLWYAKKSRIWGKWSRVKYRAIRRYLRKKKNRQKVLKAAVALGLVVGGICLVRSGLLGSGVVDQLVDKISVGNAICFGKAVKLNDGKTNVVQLKVRKQKGATCGMHALKNNIILANGITQKSANISDQLNSQEVIDTVFEGWRQKLVEIMINFATPECESNTKGITETVAHVFGELGYNEDDWHGIEQIEALANSEVQSRSFLNATSPVELVALDTLTRKNYVEMLKPEAKKRAFLNKEKGNGAPTDAKEVLKTMNIQSHDFYGGNRIKQIRQSFAQRHNQEHMVGVLINLNNFHWIGDLIHKDSNNVYTHYITDSFNSLRLEDERIKNIVNEVAGVQGLWAPKPAVEQDEEKK